jgi:ABC-2 type transport system permease protein
MKKAWTIAKRDFKTYFNSPIAYLVIAIFLAVMAWMFVPTLVYFEQESARYSQYSGKALSLTDGVIRPVYGNMNVVLLLLVPFITMRLFAEEKKLHTLELLMTSPLTLMDIVLGKFLSAFMLIAVMLGLTLIYPLSMYITGSPDYGPIVGAYLGLLLMSCSYAAVGIFYSAMTENQIIAGALSFGTILLFWIVNWMGQFVGPTFSGVLEQLSLITHYNNFSQGLLSSADLIFYCSFAGFFLFLTHRVLDSYRWR